MILTLVYFWLVFSGIVAMNPWFAFFLALIEFVTIESIFEHIFVEKPTEELVEELLEQYEENQC